MKTVDLLKNTQPVAYQTLFNGFKNNKTSHAYLLQGDKGSPLLKTAFFIAQSFLCDEESSLACEECFNCIRVQEETYLDLMVVNGEKESIKKVHIENIQENFSKSALELKGKKVYIIHKIENSNASAMNALLKFLEEPTDDVVAIITTNNISKVLNTIISRCQLIRLRNYSKEVLYQTCLEEGVDENDAKILVQFKNDINDIKEELDKGNYNTIRDLAMETFIIWNQDPSKLLYFVQTEVARIIRDKFMANTYLDILELYFKDIISAKNNENIILTEQKDVIISLSQKLSSIEDKMREIMITRGGLDLNANLSLLFDSLFYKMTRR